MMLLIFTGGSGGMNMRNDAILPKMRHYEIKWDPLSIIGILVVDISQFPVIYK